MQNLKRAEPAKPIVQVSISSLEIEINNDSQLRGLLRHRVELARDIRKCERCDAVIAATCSSACIADA